VLSGEGKLNAAATASFPIAAVLAGEGYLAALASAVTPVPPTPPIDTQGRFFALDSNNGFVAGSRTVVGKACNFLMAVGGDIPQSSDRMLVLTKPDGTVAYVRSTRLFVGEVQVTAFIGDFAPNRYVVYTFDEGELDQPGQWAVYLDVEGLFAYKTMYFRVFRS
jgi:hypothetical protein